MTTTSANRAVSRRATLRQKTAKVARWLHIYLSMVSFAVILFFAVTGLTLNHQEWFAKAAKTRLIRGTLPLNTLSNPDEAALVQHFRSVDHVSGAPSDMRVDDSEITVSLRGPGYSADATVLRSSGRYMLVETRNGFWSVLNDLHKGRDTGTAWKWGIDASAVLLTLVSLTGLVLIFFLYKRRTTGLLAAAGGMALVVLLYRLFVP
ncbi:PepSY-associated TM helix domain-containing protein [Silvibacterium sp.]|uniref:PepSY-associated TM helix domain-containing protein n=1 Tax=Silvibacterium sp. TaxID=1964179 RepID=UPI0039E70D9F